MTTGALGVADAEPGDFRSFERGVWFDGASVGYEDLGLASC